MGSVRAAALRPPRYSGPVADRPGSVLEIRQNIHLSLTGRAATPRRPLEPLPALGDSAGSPAAPSGLCQPWPCKGFSGLPRLSRTAQRGRGKAVVPPPPEVLLLPIWRARSARVVGMRGAAPVVRPMAWVSGFVGEGWI